MLTVEWNKPEVGSPVDNMQLYSVSTDPAIVAG